MIEVTVTESWSVFTSNFVPVPHGHNFWPALFHVSGGSARCVVVSDFLVNLPGVFEKFYFTVSQEVKSEPSVVVGAGCEVTMRNLQLLRCTPILDLEVTRGVHCVSVDCDTGTVYTATDRGVVGFDVATQQLSSTVSLVLSGFISADGSDSVIGIQHLPDQESVCLATASGDVILWSTVTGQLECVGSVDSGLMCMSWSPDHEIAVCATGEESIILMTKDFDPITEFPIHTSEFGEEQPINVGWGKKETQFHGSAGKPTAETLREVKPSPVLPWDDRACRVSWRGDGQYFVVSAVSPQTGARQLRVFSREGVLMSSSEAVDCLEQALAWKPSGSLIASTQRKPHRHEVVFFERNGLRHGEFILPFERMQVKVIEMQWCSDSSVLAIWLEDLPPSYHVQPDGIPSSDHVQQGDFVPKSYVQLWAVSNYHWYLKQELVFPASNADRVSCLVWDPEQALRLHIVCKGGQCLCYEWCWETIHSRGNCEQNLSTVAVIDGGNLLLTPMRFMVVPPPMASHTISLPSVVCQVAFAPPPQCSDIAVVLSDGRIAVLEDSNASDPKNGFKPPGEPAKLAVTYSVEIGELHGLWSGPLSLHQVIWWKDRTLLALAWSSMHQKDVVCELEMKREGESEKGIISLRHKTKLDEPVLRLFVNNDTGSVTVELVNGSLLKYGSDSDGSHVTPWINKNGWPVALPQPCVHVTSACLGQEEVVFGVTEHGRLYVNDKEVASNCTSFAVHDEFLLITTHAHTLRCVNMSPGSKGRTYDVIFEGTPNLLTGSPTSLPVLVENKSHPLDENIRRVERGSRIVVAVTQDTKVVLQMPRGNLETIHPRALVISYLQKCLNRLHYKDAFMAMRRHRINLNLIFDHNPKLFLDNVEAFVHQVESVNFINLFLSDLKEENTTETMYADHYSAPVKRSFETVCTTKVDQVCDAVRKAVEKCGHNKYLLTILTSHVRKTQPELETALQLVKQLKANPPGANQGGAVTPEEALKYVLFLVDVNLMYDVALGMYDFQLVLMVAEKSQKDPKEYLPFLNNLRKLESNYQKYTIDRYLKRYAKALQHLSKCGPEHFDECLSLIKEKSLYADALKLYQKTTQEYKSIAVAYGEYLVEKKKFEEAGLVLAHSGAHQKALEAFQKCGNWRQMFCMAAQLNYSGQDRILLARNISGYLKQHNRFAEASRVLEDYANDSEEAIEMLIDGCQWEEALRLMHKYLRMDILETHFNPALKEKCVHHRDSINGHKEQFLKYKARLEVVRENKEKERLEILESGTLRDDTDADLFSDTSSLTGQSGYAASQSSRGTRSTGRSSKNRRKLERKKYSLKEGSTHEDLALMAAMADIVTLVDKVQDEIAALLKMLVLSDKEEEGSLLQREFGDLLSLIEDSTSVVWPQDQASHGQEPGTQATGPDSTVNSIVEAMKRGQNSGAKVKQADNLTRPVAPLLRKDVKWRLQQLES